MGGASVWLEDASVNVLTMANAIEFIVSTNHNWPPAKWDVKLFTFVGTTPKLHRWAAPFMVYVVTCHKT